MKARLKKMKQWYDALPPRRQLIVGFLFNWLYFSCFEALLDPLLAPLLDAHRNSFLYFLCWGAWMSLVFTPVHCWLKRREERKKLR